MTISIIAAVSDNNVLGYKNNLIWHLPDDLKFFKSKTTGHHIIMGRKTFESLGGGKPLPNRTNVIITRNKNYTVDGCNVVSSLDEALDEAKSDTEIFICGGGEIYMQSIELADVMYITHIHETFEGDTFFPQVDFSKWKKEIVSEHLADQKHKHSFTIVKYSKL
jgi:dihydrofolate reductase